MYSSLESSYRKYKDRGFRVLAFPANNFGKQEPGTNAQIKSFCKTNYDVTFDLFAKVSVKGDDKCDLYQYLTDQDADHGLGGEVRWNFQKYLVDRDGKVIAKFEPPVPADDPQVIEAVEKALGAG